MNIRSTFIKIINYNVVFPTLLTVALIIVAATGALDWNWTLLFLPVLIGYPVGLMMLTLLWLVSVYYSLKGYRGK